MSESWRWMAVSNGRRAYILHLVAGDTRNSAPAEIRYDTCCGRPDTDATITEPDGSVRCLHCMRQALR